MFGTRKTPAITSLTGMLATVALAVALVVASGSSAFADAGKVPSPSSTVLTVGSQQQPVTSGLVLLKNKPSAVPGFMALKYGSSRTEMAQARYETVAVQPPPGVSEEQLVTQLMVDPTVEAASLDYARVPLGYTSTPNDPYAADTSSWQVNGQSYPFTRSWWYRATGSDSGTKAARIWPDLIQDGEPYHARAAASAFKVAVLDTGYYMDHPDTGTRIVAGGDVCQTYSSATGTYTTDMDVSPVPPSTPLSSESISAHGTCVSGQVAAATNNGVGVASIGFDNEVRVYKVQGIWIEGSGTAYPPGCAVMFDSAIIDGIQKAVADGCKVINMSLGGADYNANFQAELNKAYAAGVMVVASTGNAGTGTVLYPAAYDHVVGVGSYGLSGGSIARSSFTSYGTGLDVLAPGEAIYGLHRPGYDPDGSGSYAAPGYGSWQGTSMAAPAFAGAAAMLWRFVPDMTPDEIASVMYGTSRDLGSAGYDTSNGWGAIDVEAAYTKLKSDYPVLTTPAPVGAAYSKTSLYPVSWTAVAGADHYQVTVDGGAPADVVGTSTNVTLGATQGQHSVGVRAISAGRRWSSVVGSASVTLDTIAPNVSALSYDAAADSVSFTGEGGATTQARIDGGAPVSVTSSPWNVGALGNGPHTVELRQTDVAGNVGPWSSLDFTYYAVPGAPTLAASYDPTATPILLDWPDVPGVTAYEVQVGVAPAVSVAVSQVAVEASSTAQTVKVRSINGPKASAWSSAVLTLHPVPQAAPAVTAPASPSEVYAPWVVVAWNPVVGAIGYEYRVGLGAPVASSGTSATVSGLSLGPNEIQVRATNGAGVGPWSEPVTVTFVQPAQTTVLGISSPAVISAGRSTTLGGTLTIGGSGGLGGATVILDRLVGTSWIPSGQTTSSASGAWSFAISPSATTQYRARFSGTPSHAGSQSAAVTLGVRAVLSTPYSTTSRPVHGRTVTLRTYLSPKHGSGVWVRFYLQRLEHGAWHTRRAYSASTATAGSRSLCSARSVFPYTGAWRVVAKYATTPTNLGTTATSARITVR